MPVIQNQQTSLLEFVSFNNTEITNHNRRFSSIESINTSDVEMSSGRIRRFYKKTKKSLTFTFSYLPGTSDRTVDGRAGRDFIHNLALNSPFISVEYKDSPDSELISFNGFINNYTERIIRRELQTQCVYYDIQFEVEEQ